MGNTNVKSILINLVTLGIVTLAIMSFVIILQSDSGLDNEDMITNNTYIYDSYGNLTVELDKKDRAENSLNSLNEVPPQGEEGIGDLSISSIVSGTWTARAVATGIWNVYIKLPEKILGVDPVVSAALSVILTALLFIGIWAIWKGAIQS